MTHGKTNIDWKYKPSFWREWDEDSQTSEFGDESQNIGGETPSKPPLEEEEHMSNALLDIGKLTDRLEAAKKEHATAIAEAQKEAQAAVEALVPKFFAKQGMQTITEEPVLIATSEVQVSDFDRLLDELSLLAGDTVDITALSVNPLRLIKAAGKLGTAKRTVAINVM